MDNNQKKTTEENINKKDTLIETSDNFWNKVQDATKQTAKGVQKGAKKLSEKIRKSAHEHKIKKYNPLFPKDFKSKNFKIPNIIKIVDDAVRRNINVCEGAIGWTEFKNQTEILYLYDEAIRFSGIEFIPTAACDQIYYMDHFNRNKFIQVNCIFERTHNEKLAELEHIAHSLGAKSCIVEISESTNESFLSSKQVNTTTDYSVSVKTAKSSTNKDTTNTVDIDKEFSNTFCTTNKGRTRTYFEGNNTPTRPNLKWFANDDGINGLIDMRCSNNNSIRSRTLTLEGSTSTTMSQQVAYTIDLLLNEGLSRQKINVSTSKKIKNNVSMLEKAIKESSRTLVFDLEF